MTVQVQSPATTEAAPESSANSVFDLGRISLKAIPTPAQLDPHLAGYSNGPRPKYEKIVISGFDRQLTSAEIEQYPLIALVHDFKHLLLHGDRGTSASRNHKRKQHEPYENHYCRISLVYLINQNSTTHDISLSFIVDTAFKPIWTEFNGDFRREMTPDEVVNTVDNFIDSYLSEADSLITGSSLVTIEASPMINPYSPV